MTPTSFKRSWPSWPRPSDRFDRSLKIAEARMRKTLEHKFAETNGIRMHYVEAGRGPLVVLCHGFPESWYSWRHQMDALAESGFRVVAPDQRGYGRTEKPNDIAAYTGLHTAGDIIGLVHALGES